MVIQVVIGLRAIAKAYPSTAPDIAEINDKMRTIGAKVMQSQPSEEPSAPPMGG
jgi:hypothetical protein